MAIIEVPEVGKILVRKSGMLDQPGGGYRQYRRVAFQMPSGAQNVYTIGSPVIHGDKDRATLYGTVHAAMAFFSEDAPGEAQQWIDSAQIPFGRVTLALTVDGSPTTTKERVKIFRYYGDDDVASLAMGAVCSWGKFPGDVVFDSPSGESWNTVPLLSGEKMYRMNAVWTGDIVTSLPQVICDLLERGAAW